MLVRAELFDLKAQFKELKKARKRLDEWNSFAQFWDTCWSIFPIVGHFILFMALNSIGLGYFITRIFLYKIGWLHLQPPRGKHPWSKRKKKKRLKEFHVHSTVLNIDKRVQDEAVSFDTDSSTVICDNSANVHICNDKSMFIGEIGKTNKHYVATIGGQKNAATGMGTVRWKWTDDNGKQHTYEIKDVLYFPSSPVNILSVTGFADQLNDDEGTGIDTKRSRSTFYWNGSKYHRTIVHSPSNLPEIRINEGFSLAGLYSRAVSFKVSLNKQHCHCHASTLIPDDEDTSNSVDLSSDIFHVGETLLYTNAGHTTYVKVQRIFIDDDSVLRFECRTTSDDVIIATKESLRAPDSPDIGWIPTSVPEMKQASTELSEEEIAQISNPVKLSPLQEEFLALHERLWHLPFSVMFRLVRLGFLPKKFKKLNNEAPPCVSCLFGQAHRKPWRFKRTKNGTTSTLRGEKISEPGDTVGIDQLISAQPGLVP